jgi:hypothetical protein
MWTASHQLLTAIVDKHDDYVRELFHLDRFVTLIGFDPAVAKGTSACFASICRSRHAAISSGA